MHRRGNSPAGSRGFALIGLISALGMIAMVLVAGYSALYARQADAILDKSKLAWLEDAAKSLEVHYFSDPSMAIAGSNEAVMQNAGVIPRWEAHVLVSGEMTDAATGIRYVSLALWMPGLHDQGSQPVFDTDTGEFDICPNNDCPDDRIFRVVNSLEAQRAAVELTRKRLSEIAAKAETYAKAVLLRDPEHNLATNPFRPLNCALPEYGKPDCLDEYVALLDPSAEDTAAVLGLAPSEVVDGWGSPIEVSNLEGSEILVPPYSMTFRAATPWGQTFVTTAVQPI
ncbi:MAG: hypothetical protein QG571_1701 [Pseudomonadota bacterium]|nr:hypothetical protein [Pseudomonadota bacterium]